MLDYEFQNTVVEEFRFTQELLRRPHVVMKPRVFKDGDSWCCLLGDNIQEGVSGWGPTPEQACLDFDKTWWNGEQAPGSGGGK